MTQQEVREYPESSLEGILTINDGWGELLAKGGLGGKELMEFYSFINSHFPKEEGVEKITLRGNGGFGIEGRTDVLDLPVDILGDQLRRFRLLGLIDPKWLGHPEVASVFSSYNGLSPERINELTLVVGDFQPVIPIEGRESASSWTTALLIRELVRVTPKDSREREIKTGLLWELLAKDIFILSKGSRGVAVALGLLKKEEDWMVTLRKNGSLVHPRDPIQPGQIGHCCFTVTMLSAGLEEERQAQSLKGIPAEKVVMQVRNVTVSRIQYDQYEPRNPCFVSFELKEYDDGTRIPKTEVEVSINKKRHSR